MSARPGYAARSALGASYERTPTAEEVQWQVQGLCRQHNPQLWTPDPIPGDPTFVARQSRKAKAICLECPVVQECKNWALVHRESFGVWGGLTEEERDEILTGRKARPRRYNRQMADFYATA